MIRESELNEFLSRVVEDDNGCWIYSRTGERSGSYQSFSRAVRGKRSVVPAHRFSYEAHVGKIGDGLVIDHRCRVRSCVNPGHLEAVTHRENVIRAIPFKKPFRPRHRRNLAIRCNVTPSERAAIGKAADAEGLSLAAWVRRAMVPR